MRRWRDEGRGKGVRRRSLKPGRGEALAATYVVLFGEPSAVTKVLPCAVAQLGGSGVLLEKVIEAIHGGAEGEDVRVDVGDSTAHHAGEHGPENEGEKLKEEVADALWRVG